MLLRLFAYVILFELLNDYRPLFEVYPFVSRILQTAIKTPERFEICNKLLIEVLPTAVTSIFARDFLSKTLTASVQELMKQAIDDLLLAIGNVTESTSEAIDFLKSIQIFAGYPNDLIEDSFLNKLYDKLNLDGSESLFVSYKETFRHQKFINMLDLSEDDQITLKISSQHDRNIYSCKLQHVKYLCKSRDFLKRPKFKDLSLLQQIVQRLQFNIHIFMRIEASSTTWHCFFLKFITLSELNIFFQFLR